MSRVKIEGSDLLVGAVAAFILFDVVLHGFQLATGRFLIYFPTKLFYEIFWTTGWSLVFLVLITSLILRKKKGKSVY